MNSQWLEEYLHDHIPVTVAMGVSVEEVSTERVTLSAPLAPNINHRETVFGGSAAAVATLCAWSLVMVRMKSEGLPGRLVIARNTMEYSRPIEGDFLGTAESTDLSNWALFCRSLARKGKGRLSAASNLYFQESSAASFSGQFVAIQTSGAS